MLNDFNHKTYEALISSLQDSSHQFVTFDTVFNKTPDKKFIVLRHDVDRLPSRSMALAKLESILGVRSIYFFRVRGGKTAEKALQTVRGLGHEIGYHYEDLTDAKGDSRLAAQLFERNLDYLRKLAPVSVLAMHGRPLAPWDNRDIWRDVSYANFDANEAYLDVDWMEWRYVTDTGRGWNRGVNLRDFPASPKLELPYEVNSSAELTAALISDEKPTVLSTHPERWSKSLLGSLQVLATDIAVSSAKLIIAKARTAR